MTSSTHNPFGSLIRRRRSDLRISLRRFAADNSFDPAYISRLERGLAPPPESNSVLTRLADALDLDRESEARSEFFDLAAIQAKRLPTDLPINVVEKLPVLFRTFRNAAVDEATLDEIVNIVQAQYRQ